MGNQRSTGSSFGVPDIAHVLHGKFSFGAAFAQIAGIHHSLRIGVPLGCAQLDKAGLGIAFTNLAAPARVRELDRRVIAFYAQGRATPDEAIQAIVVSRHAERPHGLLACRAERNRKVA